MAGALFLPCININKEVTMKSAMLKKNVRVGKVVFVVNGVTKTMETLRVTKVETVDLGSGFLCQFINTEKLDKGISWHRRMSTGDYGVEEHRMGNKMFFTPQAAYRYLASLQG